MTLDYEILIVGAGPAGCAAGYDLASAGKHVLLLDKSSFPRHKPCACGLTRKTLKALRYPVDPVIERVWSEVVLEPMMSRESADSLEMKTSLEPKGSYEPVVNHGPVKSTRSVRTSEAIGLGKADSGDRVRLHARSPICALAVRERFDAFCLEKTLAAARDGGAISLRKIERIASLREGEEWVELDVVRSDGQETHLETLRAPIVLGADGANGQIRRLAATRAGSPNADPPAREGMGAFEQDGFALEAKVPYSALPGSLPGGLAPQDLEMVFDFTPVPHGYGWLFPKADHVNIGVGVFTPAQEANGSEQKQITRALLQRYAEQKLGVTTLDHVTGMQLGMGGHNYVPRGRVLLTGDAAGLVDPLTGEGIHSAIFSGQAAAAAVLACPEAERSSDVAAAYARNLRPLQRNLNFSLRAAKAFYDRPERGFKAMRAPFMRALILKTYAEGVPYTRLISALAKLTA
ncbi:MAG: FAD-dependent monooxygenase [Acidobacteriaceae bacterium]